MDRLLPEEAGNEGAAGGGFRDEDNNALARLCSRLLSGGIRAAYTIRLDVPSHTAILEQIDRLQPDLVLKRSEGRDYVVGLFTNTDWELVRQSPAHLWFVNAGDSGDSGAINRMVTAIEASPDPDEAVSSADCLAYRLANAIAGRFGATNFPVHAYQVPREVPTLALVPPLSPGLYQVSANAPSATVERNIARKHREVVDAFEAFFQLGPDTVRLVEGDPSEVLPAAAENLGADMIVMSARNLRRMERLLDSVNAEPVLARAPCDVVFAKEHLTDTHHQAVDILP